MKRWMVAIVMSMLLPMTGWAAAVRDTIDRSRPDFNTAYLVIADPGDGMFSCMGHAFLRMQCPTFGLDYCYTYESEDVEKKVLTFLAGKLKMGMFCIPTKEYLEDFRKDNRGVRQYKLNLSPEAEQHLWEMLDNRVEEGADLPFDFMQRGCAYSVFKLLRDATYPEELQIKKWPDTFDETRRELVRDQLHDYPWNRFLLHWITGPELDREVPDAEKVIIPTDLVKVLQQATINGQPVITEQPVQLLPEGRLVPATWCTPMLLAIVCVILALVSLFISKPYIDWLLLTLETVIGLFMTYLVFLSNLPTNSWNWLLIPFNPLPVIVWLIGKWKPGKWLNGCALGYAVVLIVWEAFMLFWPHQLTDWTYVVLVLALIVMYVKQFRQRA